MRERTFSRADWIASSETWLDYGPRWAHIRHVARQAGMLYPPAGSIQDDRDAAQPSQRAIVWRALEDNPAELEAIVRRSRSWSGVVDRIIGMEGRLRADADYAERDAAWDRDQAPDHREAAMSLAAILERIEASR